VARISLSLSLSPPFVASLSSNRPSPFTLHLHLSPAPAHASLVSDSDSDSDLDSDIEEIEDGGIEAMFDELCKPASVRQDPRLGSLREDELKQWLHVRLHCRPGEPITSPEPQSGAGSGAGAGPARSPSPSRAPVSTTSGAGKRLGLVFATAESVGGRHGMEDAIAAVPNLDAEAPADKPSTTGGLKHACFGVYVWVVGVCLLLFECMCRGSLLPLALVFLHLEVDGNRIVAYVLPCQCVCVVCVCVRACVRACVTVQVRWPQRHTDITFPAHRAAQDDRLAGLVCVGR